jgi:ferredoxin
MALVYSRPVGMIAQPTGPSDGRLYRQQWKETLMQAKVTDECISCELCVEACPEVFEMGETVARVTVDPIPPKYERAVRKAAEDCPVSGIIIT